MQRTTKQKIIYVLRLLLTALCLAVIGYIFSNSLQTGEESSQKSNQVVQTVQKVIAYVAPQSSIATATGDAYDKLHEIIRKMAHFSEFAILGAVLIWCYFSYTLRKKYIYIPVAIMCVVPIMDECLQLLVAGRGAEVGDVLLDILGCTVGGAFALLALGIALWLNAKSRRKKLQMIALECSQSEEEEHGER